MHRKLSWAAGAALAALVCSPGGAHASISQLTIANVAMVNQFGNPSAINSAQQAVLNSFFNKPFSMTFQYDTDATPVGGRFEATLVSGVANGDPNVFDGFSAYIRQSQGPNPVWDVMDFVLFRNAHGSSTATTEAYFTIVDAQGGLFANASALPPGVIDTSILDQVNGEIRINGGAYSLFGGGGTATAQAAPTTGGGGVPEPAAWSLMIAGFGLAGAALRRRSAAAA